MPETDISKIIASCIICDDIREEVNGKKILIGVYADQIIIKSYPGAMALQIYIDVYTAGCAGAGEIYLKVELDEEEIEKVRADISAVLDDANAKGLDSIVFVLPKFGVLLKHDATLKFKISFDSSTWIEVTKKAIRLGPVAE